MRDALKTGGCPGVSGVIWSFPGQGMADEGQIMGQGTVCYSVERFPQRVGGWGFPSWTGGVSSVFWPEAWGSSMASTDLGERAFQLASRMHAVHVPIKPLGQSQLLLPLRSHVLSQTANLLLTISADTVSDTSNSSCLCGKVA